VGNSKGTFVVGPEVAAADALDDVDLAAREAQLLSRVRRGDEQAFTRLVHEHQDRVFDLGFRMLGDRQEAEDLAQEVFATLHRALPGFRGESRLSTWVFRVARNHCLNRLKYLGRRGGAGTLHLDDVPEPVDLDDEDREKRPDHELEQRELQGLVQRAIATLGEEQRVLVVLRDIEGLSYEEIVEITQQPEGTVKSRLHRARAALAREITRLRRADPGDDTP
jgi:RNA polymerase sigma-70 factor (ECF subfamily)